jgi:hypothetical protein
MKRIVISVLFTSAVFLAGCNLEDPNSLAPDEVFVKYYGGEGIDQAADFVVNTTGLEVDSYVIFGSSDSYLLTQQSEHTEWVVIFTDGGGNLQPNGVKRFPVADFIPSLPTVQPASTVVCTPSRIKKASGGGYLLIGTIEYEVKTSGVVRRQKDMLVVKVDSEGNYNPATDVKLLGAYRTTPRLPLTTPATYDTLIFDHLGSDIVEIGEGYLCVGTTTDTDFRDGGNVGLNDIFIVKLNPALDTVWTKAAGTIDDDYGAAALSITGGTEVYVAGRSKQGNSTKDFNAVLATFPISGTKSPNSIDFQPVGSPLYDEDVVRIIRLADNDIFLAGNAAVVGGGATKPYLARITSGDVQMTTRMTELPAGVVVNDFYRTLGGRFVYAATTSRTDDGGTNGSQMLLMRTDDFGGATGNFGEDEYWGYRYGGSGDDEAKAIVQLPDGKFVILATVGIDNNPQTVIGLIKTNKNGVLGR